MNSTCGTIFLGLEKLFSESGFSAANVIFFALFDMLFILDRFICDIHFLFSPFTIFTINSLFWVSYPEIA
jgi:hypothetical protein